MSAAEQTVSRLELELWALGKLPLDRVEELERQCALDEELEARRLAVRTQVQDAATDLPALDLPEEASSWWRWLVPALGVAAAAAAAITLSVDTTPDAPDTPDVVFRGSFDLELTRVRLGSAERQGALIDVQPGDRLQWSITPAQAGWVSVFDVQDDGELQAWVAPTEASASTPVEGAVLLDDYAGSERVFFVVSDRPVDASEAELALAEVWKQPLADLDELPGLDATQRSVLLVRP